jgi:hypothetical protein
MKTLSRKPKRDWSRNLILSLRTVQRLANDSSMLLTRLALFVFRLEASAIKKKAGEN